jgi:hypothetical protein
MSYIGNTNTTQAFTPAIDYFSGNGSTTAFTLSRPVASVAQIEVIVNNVAQNPSTAYTVNGNTITFTGAPSSGTNNIYVRYTSPITQVMQPSPQSVGPTQMAAGAAVGNLGYTPVNKAGDTMTGPLTLGGLLDAGATGQIKFPATQNASADANTLDDYEEGTWTPFVQGSSTAGSATYSAQAGSYTKVGRVVTLGYDFIMTSGLSGGVGNVQIAGFPFPVANGSYLNFGAGAVGYWAGLALSVSGLFLYLDAQRSFGNLVYGGAAGVQYINVSGVQNGTRISGVVQYMTNN